jgi:hypothetical protein
MEGYNMRQMKPPAVAGGTARVPTISRDEWQTRATEERRLIIAKYHVIQEAEDLLKERPHDG